MIGEEGYILSSINRHGYIESNLYPANISTMLKTAKGLEDGLR